jgi:hypothetical protein
VSIRLPDLLRRAAGLAAGERAVAAAALFLLLVMPVLLRVRGLRPLLRAGVATRAAVTPARTRQIVVSVAACLPWTPSCLAEALTAARLIAATGGRSELVLGIGAAGTPFEAHAWLELDGGADPAALDRRPWREVARFVVEGRRR